MENERTILIESGYTTYIYRQTKTGVIDFDSRIPAVEAEKLKKELASQYPAPFAPILENFTGAEILYTKHRTDLYLFKMSVYSIEPGTGMNEFLMPVYLLTIYAEMLENRDYYTAANFLIKFSAILSPLKSLVRYFSGKRAKIMLVLYYLNLFDSGKETKMRNLLNGLTEKSDVLNALSDLAGVEWIERNMDEFDKTAADLLKEVLVTDGLSLPVVGLQYHPWFAEFAEPLKYALDEKKMDDILEGKTADYAANVRVYLENLMVELSGEPDNPADPNAIAVIIGDGKTYLKAGYIRRDVASILRKYAIPIQGIKTMFDNIDTRKNADYNEKMIVMLRR